MLEKFYLESKFPNFANLRQQLPLDLVTFGIYYQCRNIMFFKWNSSNKHQCQNDTLTKGRLKRLSRCSGARSCRVINSFEKTNKTSQIYIIRVFMPIQTLVHCRITCISCTEKSSISCEQQYFLHAFHMRAKPTTSHF